MPKRLPSSRKASTSPSTAEVTKPTPVGRAVLLLLRAYRLVISPLLPMACRFVPSCSAFAIEAVEQHGAWRGILLASRRVSRCHPWHAGGYDPVQPRGV